MDHINPHHFYHVSDTYFDRYNKHGDKEITQNKEGRRDSSIVASFFFALYPFKISVLFLLLLHVFRYYIKI